eukprot:Transcript_954.p1 GENE.Transcript_954~~Transcript_954.p1  ORF type:complete len:697 (-),score=349.19 Transcript_954:150-2240(-)
MGDHYRLLGLPQTASSDEVRAAYKDKALKSHPDRGGDPEVWAQIQQAYDTLTDPQKRAVYDRSQQNVEGGAETKLVKSFGAGAFDLSAGVESRARKGGMSIAKQLEEVAKDEERMREALRTTVIQHSSQMSHSAGFEAWLRNQQGLGKHGAYTAEDLLRPTTMGMAGLTGIEATDSTSVPLPPLTATAIRFDAHGPPADVLYLDPLHALPQTLKHGEVLVYMLAACVTEEDLLRVQTPLTILNEFPPFSRTNNKWQPIALPAVAGGEGVGIVVAAAKDVGKPSGPTLELPGLTQKAEEELIEVRDWVIALPDSRGAPVGCWGSLRVMDSARLLKVPAQQLPLQHYACSRALCTAYRLLEDYGDLRPGDTIIQNGADLPTGQAVIQLCKMLKVRSINLVPDDDGFERSKEILDKLGATHVLRDNSKLAEFLGAIGSDMPRLALDAHGGDAGRRLAIALRPGGSLVIHAMQSGQVPQLSPSVLMYHQVSLYAFNLAHWTQQHGRKAYLTMLTTLAELAQAEKLLLITRPVNVADLDEEKLKAALASHRAVQSASTYRERSVFVFGDEAGANAMYFELRERMRQLEAEEAEDDAALGSPYAGVSFGSGAATGAGGAAAGRGGAGGGVARWADATAMLKELGMEDYVPLFEEEEMTSMKLLQDIAARVDGEKELMDAFKEIGIKKMGHRQSIVNAVMGLS